MEKIIPVAYAEYGRYITRFRAIPYYADCLKPVERRLLLTMHDIAQKNVKSAKIVGFCMGQYHPHGDMSLYESLVNLVKNGFGIPKGNFGTPGFNDANPSAMRYTEARIAPWVNKFAFEYHEFVPWEELELDEEPVYLPCPIPLGLIGDGIIWGQAYHVTNIPRYSAPDLITRLKWLLDKKVFNEESVNYPAKGNGPVIKPASSNCDVHEEENDQFLSILKNGTGNIVYVPHGEVRKKEKLIVIRGRAPLVKDFNTIKKHIVEKKLNIETPRDHSKGTIEIHVKPKRGVDIDSFSQMFWEKYMIRRYKIGVVVCDEAGSAQTVGIDSLLHTSFVLWREAVLRKFIQDLDKLNQSMFEMKILPIIRRIYLTKDVKTVRGIIDHFKKMSVEDVKLKTYDITNGWVVLSKPITELDINQVCKRRSIEHLIEYEDLTSKLTAEISKVTHNIDNIHTHCVGKLSEYKIGK